MKSSLYIGLGVVLMMTACNTTSFKAGAPAGSANIIAHRGASAYAPENTLASFQKAIDLKADWFELDCTLTKDGTIVVIHDDDVKRTTGNPGKVESLTLNEIRRLDAGSWKDPVFAGEKIPTLEETLALAQKRIGIYIEIKNSDADLVIMEQIQELISSKTPVTPDLRKKAMSIIRMQGSRNLELTQKVIRLIRRYHMKDQVVLQSFSPVVCICALEEGQGIRTEFLGAQDKDKPNWWTQYTNFGLLMDPAGYNLSKDSITPERLKWFHDQHKTVAIWTVDEPAEMKTLIDMGVDSIITNKPDVAREVLQSMGKRP